MKSKIGTEPWERLKIAKLDLTNHWTIKGNFYKFRVYFALLEYKYQHC